MKQRLARFVFERCLGWHITTPFPAVEKSVIIVAPHTSAWDAILGKLVLLAYGLKHKILSKQSLFSGPSRYLMKWFGSIPAGRQGRQNLRQLVQMIETSPTMHVVLCPEGTRSATKTWNFGFCNIARMANIPVIAVYIDYRKKEIGVRGRVTTDNKSHATHDLLQYYQHVTARHPEGFALPRDPNDC